MAFFNERLMVTVLCWTARIIGVALLILITAIAIGEGGPNPFTALLRENLLGLAFLTMTLGLLVGWKWEGIGGLLIVGGFALFAIVNRPFRINAVIVMWVVTGLMYLVCWWRRARVVGERSPYTERDCGYGR